MAGKSQAMFNEYICTKKFPREELFGLSNQMRRASVSITSNISEGFGRWTAKDKSKFYQQSHGSLLELKSQLYLSKDLEYIPTLQFQEILMQLKSANSLLQGLMKSTRAQIDRD